MKRKLKGFLLALCMVVTLVGLTGCSSETELKDELTSISQDEAGNYKSFSSQWIQQVVSVSDEELEQVLSQSTDEFVISALEGWKGVREELGAFQEITEQAVKEDGDELVITSKGAFEQATANIEMVVNVKMQTPVRMTYNVNYTMAETMRMAGLNTLMGIGIVFCMLVFLSFLIAQFKHIANLEAKLAKKEEKAAQAEVSVPAAPVAEEEEPADNGRLIAVIAAAIAASENTSTDAFVVRSIKKSNARKWKRA